MTGKIFWIVMSIILAALMGVGILVVGAGIKKGFDLASAVNLGMLVITSVYVVLTLFLARASETAIKTQIDLHNQLNRPSILCDLPIIHTVSYLRIRNYGNNSAFDIHLKPNGFPQIENMAGIRHPISVLTPGSEVIFMICGPRDIGILQREFSVEIAFRDENRRDFSVCQHFDLAYLGLPGSGERGIDLGREENEPVVRELKNIVKALTKQNV